MLTIAYLANEFPSPVEPYVADEIEELRRRGVCAVSGSVRSAPSIRENPTATAPDVTVLRIKPRVLAQAICLLLGRFNRLTRLIRRIVIGGEEGITTRGRALVHTILGAYYAAMLQGRRIQHIHVHHGYFGSWIAMTAAKLLGVPFSLSLHGSDLLLHGTYMDLKLTECSFCRTISNYNRNYILERYPAIAASKVLVSRLGVAIEPWSKNPPVRRNRDLLTILSVGRLHPVKDHAFLLRACAELRARGASLQCFIAGEGPERPKLESLIRESRLDQQVILLGHVPADVLNSWYERADVVVLTSRSEGIPLVLMEAMARAKIVLAPAITGIPELVREGKTGFLYEPGSLRDFVAHLLLIHYLMRNIVNTQHGAYIEQIYRGAWSQVAQNFNRTTNLESFTELLIQRVSSQSESTADENPVLQQIQLSVQRDRSLPV